MPALAADGLITGAGFVAAPGLLSDAHWHLAWWLGGAGGIRRLATIDDPSNDQFRDYTTLEWWRFPARTGARHLTGPYVDYVCTDDYTVTITTPVVVGGQLLGVVGMDVLVDRLERELLPLLRASGASIAVVNASGRVVTSTDSRREPGSMLRLDGLDDALAPLREPRAAVGQRPAARRRRGDRVRRHLARTRGRSLGRMTRRLESGRPLSGPAGSGIRHADVACGGSSGTSGMPSARAVLDTGCRTDRSRRGSRWATRGGRSRAGRSSCPATA